MYTASPMDISSPLDIAILALAVELEGCLSIAKKLGAKGAYYRFHGVIRVEQTTYGRFSTLLCSLQSAYGGSWRGVNPRPRQRSVLEYWSVANALATRALISMVPYLSFKLPPARCQLILAATVERRPHKRARLTHGTNVHNSLISYIGAMLNAGNVDRRDIPGRVFRFLQSCAPDYLWLYDYVFADVIDRHLEFGGGLDFPYPDLDDLFERLSEGTQAYYLRSFVEPKTRHTEEWVKTQEW